MSELTREETDILLGIKPLRLDIKPSLDLRKAIDRWRAQQPEIPSRAEAARRLVELGLGLSAGEFSNRVAALEAQLEECERCLDAR